MRPQRSTENALWKSSGKIVFVQCGNKQLWFWPPRNRPCPHASLTVLRTWDASCAKWGDGGSRDRCTEAEELSWGLSAVPRMKVTDIVDHPGKWAPFREESIYWVLPVLLQAQTRSYIDCFSGQACCWTRGHQQSPPSLPVCFCEVFNHRFLPCFSVLKHSQKFWGRVTLAYPPEGTEGNGWLASCRACGHSRSQSLYIVLKAEAAQQCLHPS